MVLKKLPKILLVTLEFPPQIGGVSRYYDGLVKHWKEEVKVLRVNLKWPFWPHWLPWFWKVGRLVKKEKIEMLWVGQILPIGYVALWLKKRKKIFYAVFTHGMDILGPQKSRWKRYWLEKILAAADLVAANSEFTRGELLKLGVKARKIVVVYPCPTEVPAFCHSEPRFDQDKLREESIAFGSQASKDPSVLRPQNDNGKFILSVGRLVKRKGFDKMIGIMPRLLKRAPDLKYVIIGSGPELTALQTKISELGLSNCVEILANISDDELREWYNKCAVFALPCCQIGADAEGLGLVFLEAALAGKPVVAGRSGGAPEAMRHGYSGFAVEPGSSEELYQALLKILTDEPFAERLGAYGREWVRRNFQWESEVEKLEKAMTILSFPRSLSSSGIGERESK